MFHEVALGAVRPVVRRRRPAVIRARGMLPPRPRPRPIFRDVDERWGASTAAYLAPRSGYIEPIYPGYAGVGELGWWGRKAAPAAPAGPRPLTGPPILRAMRIARATAPRQRFGVPGVSEPEVPYQLPGPEWSAGSDLGALGARQRKRKRKKKGLFGGIFGLPLPPEVMVIRHLQAKFKGKKKRPPAPEQVPGMPVGEPLAPAAPLAPIMLAPEGVPGAPFAPMPSAVPSPGPPEGAGPTEFYEEPGPPPSEEAYMYEEVQAPWPGAPVTEEEAEAAQLYIEPQRRPRVVREALYPEGQLVEPEAEPYPGAELPEAAPGMEYVVVEEEPASDLLGQEDVRRWWWQPTEPSGFELSGLGLDIERYFRPVQQFARRLEPVVTALARPRPPKAAGDVYAVPEDTTPTWLWPALGIGGVGAAVLLVWFVWPRPRRTRRV